MQAGFLLAALMDQGLIPRREGKSRHYVLTDQARKVGNGSKACQLEAVPVVGVFRDFLIAWA